MSFIAFNIALSILLLDRSQPHRGWHRVPKLTLSQMQPRIISTLVDVVYSTVFVMKNQDFSGISDNKGDYG